MNPLIKWTGSKRKIASEIVSNFPKKIETYYEPFLGGGSVFLILLTSPEHQVDSFHISDVNPELITIFEAVRTDITPLITHYRENWEKFQSDTKHFYEVRNRYNDTKDAFDLYFLTRTCYNGTIRYNQSGKFNISHHFNRPGIHPVTLFNILEEYHRLMQSRNIKIVHSSYEHIQSREGDIVYCDPPYSNSSSLYFGNIDLNIFWKWLDKQPTWFLNFNGINKRNYETNIPIEFNGRVLLQSGKSSFSRMYGQDVAVHEYFYYRK